MPLGNYNHLSDAELHRKLAENGFPHLTITETTRNILLRKLANYEMRNSKQKSRTSTNTPQTATDSFSKNHLDWQYEYLQPRPQGIQCRENVWTYKHNAEMTTHETSEKMPFNPYKVSYGKQHSPASSNRNFEDHLSNEYHHHHGMVNRLLSFRGILNSNTYTSNKVLAIRQQAKKEKGTHSTSAKNSYIADLSSRLLTPYRCEQEFVPRVLLLVLLTFFVVLGLVYVSTMPTAKSTIELSTATYTPCPQNAMSVAGNHIHCVNTVDLKKAIDMLNEVYLQLIEAMDKLECISSVAEEPQLNAYDTMPAKRQQFLSFLPVMYHLIDSNPQWNLKIIDNEGEPFKIGTSDLPTNQVNFKLKQYQLPKVCILYRKIHKFLFIIGTGTLIGILLLALFFVNKYIRSRCNEKREAVNIFTTEILNNALQLHNNAESNFLLISELRNKLVSPDNSALSEAAFNEALRLLKLRDNRLEFGLSMYNGEEVETIKWAKSKKPELNCNGVASKKWQSPAFDNINRILNPPTPCLKIRHMFDASDAANPHLKSIIQNAIKSKVGPRCSIIDINIDKATCCVYVRCASNADAGIVHNEINGWWFDMRLVSIKFLRLQRYLSRFPDTEEIN